MSMPMKAHTRVHLSLSLAVAGIDTVAFALHSM